MITIESLTATEAQSQKRGFAKGAPVVEFVAKHVRPALEKVAKGRFVTMKIIFKGMIDSGELKQKDDYHYETKTGESMAYSTLWLHIKEALIDLKFEESKKGLWERK